MHVQAKTELSPQKVRARFEAHRKVAAKITSSGRRLTYAANRKPPKFFLHGAPIIPPAAAEVSLAEQASGTDVVLRLMWGPLPAPFPRVLAGVGLVLGLFIAAFSDRSIGAWLCAGAVALLPVLTLLYQQRGEIELQSQLTAMLDGARFSAKPH